MKTHPFVLGLGLVLLALPACKTPTSSAPDPERAGDGSSPHIAQTGRVLPTNVGTDPGHALEGTKLAAAPGNELAAFSAGCFWGVEETFRQVPGVVATAVGYTGGHTDHPTYESVCTHTTGHAETVLVEFDPKKISYESLLNVFFKNHDPTTMNRQGPDYGDQYRSAIFTLNDAQAAAANTAKTRETKDIGETVVTQISPLGSFWAAEEYHQQYDEKTGERSCPIPKGLPRGT